MKNEKLVLIALFVLLFLLEGCATVVKGGKQKVTINSIPSKAYVKVFDKSGKLAAFGETPFEAELSRGAGAFSGAAYKLVFEKSGYFSKEMELKSQLDWGWFVGGNIPLAIVPGLLIDPVTGAMWNLADGKVDADLNARNWKN